MDCLSTLSLFYEASPILSTVLNNCHFGESWKKLGANKNHNRGYNLTNVCVWILLDNYNNCPTKSTNPLWVITPAVEHPCPSITLRVLAVFTFQFTSRPKRGTGRVKPRVSIDRSSNWRNKLVSHTPDITCDFAGALLHQNCLTSASYYWKCLNPLREPGVTLNEVCTVPLFLLWTAQTVYIKFDVNHN